MSSIKILNPEFWIRDYYDYIINRIDIYIETEIEKELRSNIAASGRIDYLNSLRDDFLREIKSAENENLIDYYNNESLIDSLIKQYKNDEYELEKCIEVIKEKFIFKKFCFLIKNTEKNLLYLVVTDIYFNEKDILYINNDDKENSINKMSVIKFIVKNSLPEVACKKVLINFKTLNEINFESKSLNELNTQHSNISEIDLSSTDFVPFLKKLTISIRSLNSIKPNSFYHTNNLNELHINYTGITAIKSNLFKKLINLHVLNLSNNKIAKIDPDSFESLIKLEKLDLSFNKINEIQSDLFKNLYRLKYLDLLFNKTLVLFNYAFDSLTRLEELQIGPYRTSEKNILNNLKSLKFLNIDNDLDAGILDKLTGLNRLKISYKYPFKIFKQGTFQKLVDLNSLTLTITELKADCIDESYLEGLENLEEFRIFVENVSTDTTLINEKIFIKLPKLKKLRIHIDSVFFYTKINLETILNYSELRVLNLNENNLRIFDFSILDTLVNLEELHMDKCNLGNQSFLMNPFRKKFESLKALSLSKNQISTLYWIRSFPKLEELNLSWNQINDLRENLFDYSTNLRNLILYKNKINFINLHSFNGLGQVEELDLRYNEIMSIQSNDFKWLCNLKVLLLNGNFDLTVNKAFLKHLKNLEHLFISSNHNLKDFVAHLNENICLHEDFFYSNQAHVNNQFKLKKEGNDWEV